MRPMTAREALGHTRDLYRRLSSMDTREAVKLEHADALLDALVELREATQLWAAHNWAPSGPEEDRVCAAGAKLAALERGESPEES